jgi:hypothetical protein
VEQPAVLPVEQLALLPVEQPALLPVEQPAVLPVEQLALLPVEQLALLPVKQLALLPVEQPAQLPVEQLALLPVEQPALLPVEQLALLPVEQPALPAAQRSKSAEPDPNRFFKGIMFFFAVTVAGGSHNATWTELCPGRSTPMTDATESCAPKISPEFMASLRTSESTSRLIERIKRSAADVSEDEEKVGGKLLKQSADLSTTMKILQ